MAALTCSMTTGLCGQCQGLFGQKHEEDPESQMEEN